MAEERQNKVDAFVCNTCGSTMQILQDDLGHRKAFCKHCGNIYEIIDSDKERLETATIDDKIYEMKYKRDHPVKSFMKDWGVFFVCIGIMFGLVLFSHFAM